MSTRKHPLALTLVLLATLAGSPLMTFPGASNRGVAQTSTDASTATARIIQTSGSTNGQANAQIDGQIIAQASPAPTESPLPAEGDRWSRWLLLLPIAFIALAWFNSRRAQTRRETNSGDEPTSPAPSVPDLSVPDLSVPEPSIIEPMAQPSARDRLPSNPSTLELPVIEPSPSQPAITSPPAVEPTIIQPTVTEPFIPEPTTAEISPESSSPSPPPSPSPHPTTNALAGIDDDLADLPAGYGDSRIVLMPRDPQWAYTYWDIPDDHRSRVRQQGGGRLALRLYDVTDIDIHHQNPHNLQQYDVEEMARDWYVPIPISDRDYLVEIGYLANDGRWLMLARSNSIRIPPFNPSNWSNDQFLTLNWDEDLFGKPLSGPLSETPAPPSHDTLFALAQRGEAERIAGSLYGSKQAVSSHTFPSGVGMSGMGMSGMGMSGMGMSGIGMSGVGMSGVGMSGIGMSGIGMSGIGMSGIGMFSGAGLLASMPSAHPRKFWLIANAELTVYGATEPGANLTIAGQPVPINPDGTFRFQMTFPDGTIDYPILAVAADGMQSRSIHLQFNRTTPTQDTNTKEEATEDWFRE